MKKHFLNISSLTLIIVVLLFACNKEKNNDCISYNQAPINSVTVPASGQVNQNIPITISFGCYNGCGQFGSIEETNQGNTKEIKIIAKYEGCICTQDAPVRQTTYNFNSTTSGTFILKFLQNNNSFIVDTIIIQ